MSSTVSQFQSLYLDQGSSSLFTCLPREICDSIYQLYASVDAIADGDSTKNPESLFLDEDNPFNGGNHMLKLACQRAYYEMLGMRYVASQEVAVSFYSHWSFRLQLAVKGRLDWARIQTIYVQLRNEDKYDLNGARFMSKALSRTKHLKVLYIDCSRFNESLHRAIQPNIVVSSPEPQTKDEDTGELEQYGKLHWVKTMLADCGTALQSLERVVFEGKGPAIWPREAAKFVNTNVEVIELR